MKQPSIKLSVIDYFIPSEGTSIGFPLVFGRWIWRLDRSNQPPLCCHFPHTHSAPVVPIIAQSKFDLVTTTTATTTTTTTTTATTNNRGDDCNDHAHNDSTRNDGSPSSIRQRRHRDDERP